MKPILTAATALTTAAMLTQCGSTERPLLFDEFEGVKVDTGELTQVAEHVSASGQLKVTEERGSDADGSPCYRLWVRRGHEAPTLLGQGAHTYNVAMHEYAGQEYIIVREDTDEHESNLFIYNATAKCIVFSSDDALPDAPAFCKWEVVGSEDNGRMLTLEQSIEYLQHTPGHTTEHTIDLAAAQSSPPEAP